MLSDGKYGFIHFNLAAAYFDAENWESARESYQKAAELDPKEPLSAYNVALCLSKQKLWLDSAQWYEEYLKRRPDAPDRAEVLNRIRILRE